MKDFKQVINDRANYFKSKFHHYESERLKNALKVINKLVPPEEFLDVEDLINKLNCLNGYLKEWVRGGKIPNELEDVINECDEYLGIKNDKPTLKEMSRWK